MSADGRSLIGNELSHHPKGTSFALLFRNACLRLDVSVCFVGSWHVSLYADVGVDLGKVSEDICTD